MKQGWKALTGVAAALALVIAPVMTTGALAEDAPTDDPAAAVAVADEENKVFVCKYVGTPGVNERADHIISVSTSTLDGFDGSLPFEFSDGQNQSVAIAFDTGQPEPSIEACPAGDSTTEVTPPAPTWTDPCGPGNGYWTATPTAGVVWTHDIDEIGQFVVRADPAEGYHFPEDAARQWSNWDSAVACPPTDFPIPGQFNAGPTVTCGEADSFDTSFLGQPLSAEGSVYQFENIYVEVDRSVAGQVTLTIWPIDGFTISGLSDAWDQGEGNFFRTIELNGPVPCPLADIPVTLTAPALDPQCGTDNDELLFPEDIEGVTYYWEDDNPDNFNVVAVVEAGYVVDPVPAGWELIDESETETVYLYAWVPVPNDEPCPVTPAPAGTPAPAPALAATGGDMSPLLPIGAAMLMLTGVALMVARRLIRH